MLVFVMSMKHVAYSHQLHETMFVIGKSNKISLVCFTDLNSDPGDGRRGRVGHAIKLKLFIIQL